MCGMAEQTFRPGDNSFVASDAPGHQHGAFFEDDGETGYFYAVDLTRAENKVLDAMSIYDVKNVTERDRPSVLSIVWSGDGLKCALLINGHAHAVFDFAAKRGFCRTNFPNFPDRCDGRWPSSDHGWSEDAVAWLQ